MTRRPAHFAHSLWATLVASTLSACAVGPPQPLPLQQPLMPALRQALESPQAKPEAGALGAAPEAARSTPPDALAAVVPKAREERRFTLTLANTSPEVLFMALLNDTPLSVAVDPGVKGPMSVTLKDVSLREALDLLRELHNLEYKVVGRHILVAPATLQTRMFTVDYPSFSRSGRSDLRVVSGGITGGGGSGSSSGSNNSNNSNNNTSNNGVAAGGGGNSTSNESSHVSTAMRNDLWSEVEVSLKLLVGDKEGRQVIVSPQTGNILIRALPKEIRAAQEYLDAVRINTQRQVMLEAKVVEVQLRDSERSGINWAAFKSGLSSQATVGMANPGATLGRTGSIGGGLLNITPGDAIASAASNTGSILGLAFQTANFAAVLEFLATQGNTQVLSSPRIATMNNQKAVLKVGTDDFFVTNISSTTTAVGNSTATTPNISVMPFFSGISLDVTPNVNAEGYITLHIHPAVSNVTERSKVLNLGAQGTFSLPLASSDINETDAVVRARDGQIIAIGGLMRQATASTDSGMPGAEGQPWRKLSGGQTTRLTEKRELVILLKPTVIDPSREDDPRRDPLARLLEWTDQQPAPAAAPAPALAAQTVPADRPARPAAPAAAPTPIPAAEPAPVQAPVQVQVQVQAPVQVQVQAPAPVLEQRPVLMPAPAPTLAPAPTTTSTQTTLAAHTPSRLAGHARVGRLASLSSSPPSRKPLSLY